MLSPIDRDRYQTFQQHLEQMQQIAAQAPTDIAKLQDTFAQLQPIFASQIANSSNDHPNTPTFSRYQSYVTEIDKQMRLLAIDLTFLQAARQSATAQTRIAQIVSRLNTLISYCQALLETKAS